VRKDFLLYFASTEGKAKILFQENPALHYKCGGGDGHVPQSYSTYISRGGTDVKKLRPSYGEPCQMPMHDGAGAPFAAASMRDRGR
jgi:hypothetical protein